MILMSADKIPKIDDYAEANLAIPKKELMQRSAAAIAAAVRKRIPLGGRLSVLAGCGNNGGDGYAAAALLSEDYEVRVFDVFGKGQRSDEGKYYLDLCIEQGIDVKQLNRSQEQRSFIASSDAVIECILGTGVNSSASEALLYACRLITEARGVKLAADVPVGTDPNTGEVADFAPHFDVTVALSFIKPGCVSYPGKEYAGEIEYSSLSLPTDKLCSIFDSSYVLTDESWARKALPFREDNSNKGSFGKLYMLAGSRKYRGAARLSLEAALRGGVGYVLFSAPRRETKELLRMFPEAVYETRRELSRFGRRDIEKLLKHTERASCILLGTGCDTSAALAELTLALLSEKGAPLVLDADAINSLSLRGVYGLSALKNARRAVILTPHPLEFSRLCGKEVSEVQSARLRMAEHFAREHGVILILKGAASVITDGEMTYINSTGSSALAKAGSGDCLAGLVGSLVAMGTEPTAAAALACYYHGKAADTLAKSLSTYGVTPSDLPRAMAQEIACTEASRNR